jgi:hypothetical protein
MRPPGLGHQRQIGPQPPRTRQEAHHRHHLAQRQKRQDRPSLRHPPGADQVGQDRDREVGARGMADDQHLVHLARASASRSARRIRHPHLLLGRVGAAMPRRKGVVMHQVPRQQRSRRRNHVSKAQAMPAPRPVASTPCRPGPTGRAAHGAQAPSPRRAPPPAPAPPKAPPPGRAPRSPAPCAAASAGRAPRSTGRSTPSDQSCGVRPATTPRAMEARTISAQCSTSTVVSTPCPSIRASTRQP